MNSKRKNTRRTFGGVRKIKSGYQASYTDKQGKRNYSPNTFTTVAAADLFLANIQTELQRGSWVNPDKGKITLVDWWNTYNKSRPDWRSRTRELNESHARLYLLAKLNGFCLADRSLGSISPTDLRKWFAAVQLVAEQNTLARKSKSNSYLARAWAIRNEIAVPIKGKVSQRLITQWKAAGSPTGAHSGDKLQKAGSTAAAQSYRLMHQVFAAAVMDQIIFANPCSIANAGQTKKTKRKTATPEQIAALALAAPDRYAAAVYLAGWSGLRAGELFALQRQDFDPQKSEISVNKAVQKLSRQAATIGATKTAASVRTVTLPHQIAQILAEHLERYTGTDQESIIFTTPSGALVTSSLRDQWWSLTRRSLNLSELRWQDLRHTAATTAAQSGATITDLQAIIGHSTVAAAMHYQQTSAAQGAKVAKAMDSKVIVLDHYRSA
jgi:integrase